MTKLVLVRNVDDLIGPDDEPPRYVHATSTGLPMAIDSTDERMTSNEWYRPDAHRPIPTGWIEGRDYTPFGWIGENFVTGD